MESVKAGSQSTQICFQEDIKIVLDGTKSMMGLMELKKEEIAELEQDITKNENSFTNMRNLVRNLKETINKNFADIENRSNFTNEIEEYKTKFIPTAQTIYTIVSDFNKVINSADTTLNEFIDIANTNEQIYNKETQCYNQEEKRITTELEETVKVNFQDTENKEALAKENNGLVLEIEDLANEVELYAIKIEDSIGFEENNNNLKQEIIMSSEQCKNQDDEVLVAFKSFDSINLQSQQDNASISSNIVNYEMKISELVKDSLQHLLDKLESLMNKENNYDTELLVLKDSTKKSENVLITLSNKSEELNKQTIESQEMFDKEIISHTETLTKIEESIKCNQEINSRFSEKIEARETDIELFNSDVNVLKVIMTDLVESPKEDVGRQSEVKQDKLNGLNLELQNAKETYKLDLIEKQEMLQAQITDIENRKTKRTEYMEKMKAKLKEIQDKTLQLQEEKNSDEKILQELKRPVIPAKRLRRWDSDSTIGEEN